MKRYKALHSALDDDNIHSTKSRRIEMYGVWVEMLFEFFHCQCAVSNYLITPFSALT